MLQCSLFNSFGCTPTIKSEIIVLGNNEILIGNSPIQILRGNLIKALPQLGPEFKISFDLKINSWGINSTELESILRFTSNDEDCCHLRSCCGNPAVFLHPLIGPHYSHIMVMTKTSYYETIHPYISVPGLGKWFSVSLIQVNILFKSKWKHYKLFILRTLLTLMLILTENKKNPLKIDIH